MTKRRITVDGFTFAVVDEGSGPAVLLLHGLPDSSALWRHQVRALVAAGFRVVAPDLRGFGDSDKPAEVEGHRLHLIAADVIKLLDARARACEAGGARRARARKRNRTRRRSCTASSAAWTQAGKTTAVALKRIVDNVRGLDRMTDVRTLTTELVADANVWIKIR